MPFDTKFSLKPLHTIKIFEGVDSNRFVASCTCGWSHCNTQLACQLRADLHCHIATDHRWNDPKRKYEMPTNMENVKQRLA